jgi:Xaa-Pro aminopeptidase
MLPPSAGVHLFRAALTPFTAPTGVTLYDQCHPRALAAHLQSIAKRFLLKELAVDETAIFVAELHALHTALPQTHLSAFERKTVWQQRVLKDSDEFTAIAEASRFTRDLLATFPQWLREGVTEKELAWKCEHWLRSQGADGLAFPTIVAFGEHSALPHHQPDDTQLTEETVVLLDVGARRHTYASDATRTWWFGARPSDHFHHVEHVVRDAYQAALQRCQKHAQVPTTAADIDYAARQVIRTAGWDELFIHTTGHGLGLDIHEPPSLNLHNPEPLLENMVITIEPGVYFSGEFGYRYENTVALTSAGVTELTL